MKNVVERPKRRKTETRRTKTDVRAPAARFTAVTVGIGEKRRENVAKRVETCEKLGRTVETEENGNTTDDKRRKTDVHAPTDGSRSSRWGSGRNVGKTWPNGWNQVKNVVERP